MFNSLDGPDTSNQGTSEGGLSRTDGSNALAAVAMDVASKQVQSSIFASSPFSSSSSSSSTRRRDRSEGNLDDLLNAITNKLGNADIQDSKSQLVAAFVEVMQCSDMEADFYLESSNMDIATAISLCMDAREDMERDQNMFRRNNANSSTGKRHRSLSDAQGYNVKYNGKQIYIADLPSDWIASVDKVSGRVIFLHIESGVTQYEVPPGYDDIVVPKVNVENDKKMEEDDLSIDERSILPSALDDAVIMKSGTGDTDGGDSASGLSSAPVERMDAFDQHDDL